MSPNACSAPDLDFAYFKRRIRERVGIDLECYKPEQMRRRLGSLMQRSSASSFAEYFHMIEAQPDKLREFRDFFTINVSEFFRNPEKFDQLAKVVLPKLLSGRPRLRIWSAACSYGAEPYSIAMLLAELTPQTRHYILGTDVDQTVLKRAQDADSYTEQDLRSVPAPLRQKYFQPGFLPGHFALADNIRGLVTFKTHDLLRDPFERDFDLIVCRNVVIYFTEEAKQRVHRSIYQALRPGGCLFVGGTEIVTSGTEIGFASDLLGFYRK